ncbi:MAG: DUF3155 domain-containing protein [Prochloron sp. SP5CPC1]|nr:DUF3155 domain-containing protein [Candidatus Paraprochloron terpiosi SP5CPC1]
MARKRKGKSRRRLEGRKILELIPHYNLESGEDKPVTENHFLFPSLREFIPLKNRTGTAAIRL